MPARNIHHDLVRGALAADGWTVTADPLTLAIGRHKLYVDLGASRDPIAAERDGRRIAVEIQSFVGRSQIDDLHHAVGQFVVYRAMRRRQHPDRTLYLAVPQSVADDSFAERIGEVAIADLGL